MPNLEPDSRIELIDFGCEIPPARLSYAERIVHDGLSVSRCLLQPNPGVRIGTVQHTVIIHEGAPFDLDWRLPDSGATERHRVVADDLHINAAERPLFFRWQGSPKALVIALEQSFIERVISEAFDGGCPVLRTRIAIRDPVIDGMAVAWRKELAERGSGGRLYAEGLGSALAVHLYRTYGDRPTRPTMATGGLGPQRLRRVTEHIEAHLAEEVGLQDLADVAGLSLHHFSAAFKASTGMPPHRYQIDRRIRRAKELLLGTDHSITVIALELGFASPSHFTDQFRKWTKTTPSRFRMDRR
jgi:AraC family transcriptional regulator